MKSLQEYIDRFKEDYPNWSEEGVINYATKMYNKMSTVKRGDNIIHLDYFDGLIISNEISEIENLLEDGKLELSRFDKRGITYNSIDDFTLQVSLCLSDPIVQNILLGVAGNIIWDSIKKTSIFIWKTIKKRHWDNEESNKRQKINFGLRIKTEDGKNISLNLDSELSGDTLREALDKSFEVIKELNKTNKQKKSHELSYPTDFYVFDKEKKLWLEVDIMEEIRKKHLKQNL
ncbi:hypothetical protein J2810_001103 [Chryseobacterium rhizosphaerae]|uniref:hypothetical protein n=1 Tax=Chryseobacterium rhizosphaerae TaxID=395937 RepID=UPI0028663E96|nr:hypothetical protein [Chryseobacterium rhizosphaerae]MDR6545061.1 hypothetical protein [Chryseobacterium rhizosphaerae]